MSTAGETRDDLIGAMAQTMVKHNATANERDSIRCLVGRGFRAGDIAALSDRALAQARSLERAAIASARANEAANKPAQDAR